MMKIRMISLADTENEVIETDEDKKESMLQQLWDEPEKILTIEEPTDEQKEVALTEMPELIAKLKSPTEDDFLIAVRTDGMVLGLIKNREKKIIDEALKQNGLAIKFVDSPTDDQIRMAILSAPFCIRYLKNLESDMIMLALRNDGLAIQFLDNPSESQQIVAVKEHPSALSLIENPTRKVKMAALEEDGLSIEFIKDPDEALQLLAIDKSVKGYAFRYISHPTSAVTIAAFKKNKDLARYFKEIPEQVQLELIAADQTQYTLIKNPTKKTQELYLRYIKDLPHIFDNIPNIDTEVLEKYLYELEFKEKADKRMQIPKGLNLPQLVLYRFFQSQSKKEVQKLDFKSESFVDDRTLKIIKSVKGNYLKLDDVINFKKPPIETELGNFIQKKYHLAKLLCENEIEPFGVESNYFVVYVDAMKLLDLEFTKQHISEMTISLADKKPPYLPCQYILGYIRYTCYKQNVWIDDIWNDTKLRSSEDELAWLSEWAMSLFIREMRYRNYDRFYAPNKSIKRILYSSEDDFATLLERAYFKQLIVTDFHPLINGKDLWVLS